MDTPLWDAKGLKLYQTLTLQTQTAVFKTFVVPGLWQTSYFFGETGLIMLGAGLPTFVLVLWWLGSVGEGKGGKSPSLNENETAFLYLVIMDLSRAGEVILPFIVYLCLVLLSGHYP